VFDYQEYRDRYSQHILFYEAGVDDRQKVHNARVAVIGLGSIGIEASRLLAIAQVKLLRFIYWDEMSADDVPAIKAPPHAPSQECLPNGMAAVRELAAANPSLVFEVVNAAEIGRLQDLLQDINLVLYEDDNSERRALVSESCCQLHKPWIYAEAHGASGMTVNVLPGITACIDCVRSRIEANDKGLQYLPTVTDLIARTLSQVQAMEALRILGNSPNISAEAFCFDVDNFGHSLSIIRNEACPNCRS